MLLKYLVRIEEEEEFWRKNQKTKQAKAFRGFAERRSK